MIKETDTKLHSPRLLTVIFSLLQVLKMLLSLVLVWFSARLFGAGIDREAWVVGWGAQMWLFKLLFTPVNESFRARFLQIRQESGAAEALQSFFALLLSLILFSLVLIGLIVCFSGPFLQLIAPGYTGQAGEQAIRLMMLYLLPILLLSECSYLFTALLNCYRNFYLPEVFGLLTIVLNLLLLFLAGDRLGISSFLIANYTGLLILVALLAYRAYKMELLHVAGISRDRVVRFFGFAAPLYIAAIAMQFNVWAERRMLSYLAIGSNAALDYARKFVDAPVIFVASLSTAVVAPLLAGVAGKEDGHAFRREAFLFLRTCLLVLSPALILCTVHAGDLIRAFLLHGRFDVLWEPALTQSLRYFGYGLPGTVICMIAGQVMIVRQKVRVYALVSVVAQLVPVLINYLYFRTGGLPVFAMSWAIGQSGAALFLLMLSGLWELRELKGLLKIGLICLCSMATAEAIIFLLSVADLWLRLAALVIIQLLLLLTALRAFRMEEFLVLQRLWARKTRI